MPTQVSIKQSGINIRKMIQTETYPDKEQSLSASIPGDAWHIRRAYYSTLTLKALWKPGLDFEGLLPTPTEQQRPEKKHSNQPLGLTGQVRNSEWERRLEKSTETNIWSSLNMKQKNVSKGIASWQPCFKKINLKPNYTSWTAVGRKYRCIESNVRYSVPELRG